MILQEDLKGLKKGINKKVMKENKYNHLVQPHRKLPRKILGRLNRAAFNQIQNMINYKAEWKNVPYQYVSARNNSKTCPICGGKNKSAEWHRFICSCGVEANRDLVACMNIIEKKRTNEDEGLRYGPDREVMNVINAVLNTNFPVYLHK